MKIVIHLLGKPTVMVKGETLRNFRSAKALTLLAYLIVAKRNVRRAELATLFWPDLQDPLPELRRSLYDLKRKLPGVISAERRTVTVNASACSIDLEQLQQQLLDGSPTALTAALTLYRGDFLETISIEEDNLSRWLIGEREQWRERLMQLLRTLIAQAQTQRQFTIGVQYARQLVALAPWREENQRLLIDLLDQAAQPGAALDQYAQLRSELEAELAVEPSEETERLVERVRRGRAEVVSVSAEKHAAANLALAKKAYENFSTSDQVLWLTMLDQNNVDLRDALFWSLANDPTMACQLCDYLWQFWRWRSQTFEGYEWVQQALAVGEGVVSAELLGRIEWAAGLLATLQQKEQRAIAHLQRSIRLQRGGTDQNGLARALVGLGARLVDQPNTSADGLSHIEEGLALYCTLGSEMGQWYAYNTLGEAHRTLGNLTDSERNYELGLEMAQQLDSPRPVAVAMSNMSGVQFLQGRYRNAWDLLQVATVKMLQVGDDFNVAQCVILGAGILAAVRPKQQPEALRWLLAACNSIALLNLRTESADAVVTARAAELCGHYLPDPQRPRFIEQPGLPSLNEAAEALQSTIIQD